MITTMRHARRAKNTSCTASDVHAFGHLAKPCAVGWTLTVEPGIYIPEERLAVRLENLITITATGQDDLMADIPIEADDIERLMASRALNQRPA